MIKKLFFALFFVMYITLFPGLGAGQETKTLTFTLTWDESPSSDLDYYVVHWGTESGVYTYNSGDIGLITSWDLTVPDDGKIYYVAVTVVDLAGLESDFSNEVHTGKPKAPGNLQKKVVIKVSVIWEEEKNAKKVERKETFTKRAQNLEIYQR